MKTIPTLTTADSETCPITRSEAAAYFRRERSAKGKMHRWTCGILLVGQQVLVTIPRAPKYRPPEPPQATNLHVRLTHKYNPGWSHLDKSHDLGSCVDVAARDRKWDDSGESFRQLIVVEMDADAAKYRPRNLIRAIHDTFQFGCRCEHDCCNCVQSYVRKVRRLCDNRYAVILAGYHNV